MTTSTKWATWDQKLESTSGRFSSLASDGWIRVSNKRGNQIECPICHKNDKGCLVHESGDQTLCAVESSDQPRNTTPPTWLHSNKESRIYSYNSGKKTTNIVPQYRATDEACDKLYRWLLEQCPLTIKYKAELAFSGLKDLSMYGTLKQQTSNRILIPFEIEEGIPGTFKEKGRWYVNASITGLLLPVINSKGQIYRIEIKIDERCKAFMGAKTKYVSLTSDGKDYGCSPNVRRFGVVHGKSSHRIYFTEGRKKAQVVAEKTGHTCVYMTGVGNWRFFIDDVVDSFPETKEIAFAIDADADPFINKAVYHHKTAMLAEAVKLECMSIFDITWDPQVQEDKSLLYKGIDDALLSSVKLIETKLSDGVPLISAEEAAKGVKQKAAQIIDAMDHGIHLFEVTVGAGKTTGLIEIFNEHYSKGTWPQKDGRDARILWLVDDNYKLLAETENRFTFPVARMEGRTDKQESPFFCPNYEEVKKAGAAHHNVMRSVCTTCPFKPYCPYLTKKDQVLKNERFVIGVKSSFLNKSNRTEQFDVIIVDESMSDHAFVKKNITNEDIELHLQIIEYVKRQDIYSKPKYKASIDSSERALNTLRDFIELNEGSTEESSIEYRFDEISTIYLDKKEIKKYVLENYGYHKEFLNEIHKSKMHIYNNQLVIDVPNYKLLETMREKVVINLDATPRHHKLRVFGPIQHHKYNVRQFMNVYQILSHKGSKQQLAKPETAARFLKAIEGIATKNPKNETVVLTSKFFAEQVLRYAEDSLFDVSVGWYGNHTRGFNKFEKADNVILVGNYCRNLSVMRMEHRLLEMLGIEVSLEELVEEDSINEMTQAIGRGRATRREGNPVNVFLLSNRTMAGLYNVKFVPSLEFFYDEMEKDQQKANKARKDATLAKIKPFIHDFANAKHITEIPVARLAEAAGVSRNAATEALKQIYLEELKTIVTDRSKWFYLNDLAQQLKPLTTEMALAFGLNLTSARASVLDKYKADDLADVISRHSDLYDYLLAHQPISVNQSKWQEYISYLKLKSSDNALELEHSLSRQSEANYLEYASQMVKAYFEDHFESPYDGQSVIELNGEPTSTLKNFALSLYHDLNDSLEESKGAADDIILAAGLTKSQAEYCIACVYYANSENPYSSEVAHYMKLMFEAWVSSL